MMNENLGPAERIVQAVLAYSDHLVHNRPGMVVPDASSVVGLRWLPVTYRLEKGVKNVYRLDKVGARTRRVPVGQLLDSNSIVHLGKNVGSYRAPGLFPEVAAWMYRQVAEIWKLDNEFAARWASFAYADEHRDLKVVLTAFMLVQSRKGDPVLEDGKVVFSDDDFRDVGEAMMLLYERNGHDLNPKLLLRIHDLLSLPAVADVNRELGFGRSGRRPFLGRWTKAVEKWLRFREENPKLLAGLVKAGFRRSVMELARRAGFKPQSPEFFQALRWKQVQADDGRRGIAIGLRVASAETWQGLSEEAICERIVRQKPNFKRIVGLLPKELGLTRAVVAAAIEAGSMSPKDLVILSPTLEELGLFKVQEIREKWEAALRQAEDARAANVAVRVRSKQARETLEQAADAAVKKAAAEVMRGLRVYFMVDISGSMQASIEKAKRYVSQFLQGFPLDRLHVAVFNTQGRALTIQHASAAGVVNAFRGITAGGGTDYGAGVRALQDVKPQEDEDTLFVFVGDEQAGTFETAVERSFLRPLAFGLVKVGGAVGDVAVRDTARKLGIPCFRIEEASFDDPYAIPRVLRRLIASTPVERSDRVTLAERILKTEILKKPVWAA
ncbi:MAG TPA: vWA domain-containing protein [Polyangiaceae bacterium]|nr:vWA domain-containing protein [Polyangiaceae bacterium]